MKYIISNIIALLLFNSCLEVDCKELQKVYSNEECIIVVKTPPKKYSWFKVEGYTPSNMKQCECKSVNRWWSQFTDEISIGDTIIKKKGELSFNIHKKDTIITHYWKCQGESY